MIRLSAKIRRVVNPIAIAQVAKASRKPIALTQAINIEAKTRINNIIPIAFFMTQMLLFVNQQLPLLPQWFCPDKVLPWRKGCDTCNVQKGSGGHFHLTAF